MKTLRLVSMVVFSLMLLSLISSTGNARAQGYAYQEDFEDGAAQDLKLDPGWQVIQDEGNYVLSGQGRTWSNANKPFDDYRLSFRLKLLSGSMHLNFRINTSRRYFIYQPAAAPH